MQLKQSAMNGLSYPGWQQDFAKLDVNYPSLIRGEAAALQEKQRASERLTYPGWESDLHELDVNYPSLMRSQAATLQQRQQEYTRRRQREEDDTAQERPRQRRRVNPPASLPRGSRREREDDAEHEERPAQRARVEPPPPDEQSMCTVCLDTPKTHIFVPCGHLCVCETCSGSLDLKCPICRTTNTMVIRAYQT